MIITVLASQVQVMSTSGAKSILYVLHFQVKWSIYFITNVFFFFPRKCNNHFLFQSHCYFPNNSKNQHFVNDQIDIYVIIFLIMQSVSWQSAAECWQIQYWLSITRYDIYKVVANCEGLTKCALHKTGQIGLAVMTSLKVL